MKTETQIDPEILEIVPLFLSSRKEDLKSISTHLENKDFESIRKIAHTIKGISRPYGFPSLEILSKQLEEHAKSQDIQHIRETFELIQSYLAEYDS